MPEAVFTVRSVSLKSAISVIARRHNSATLGLCHCPADGWSLFLTVAEEHRNGLTDDQIDAIGLAILGFRQLIDEESVTFLAVSWLLDCPDNTNGVVRTRGNFEHWRAGHHVARRLEVVLAINLRPPENADLILTGSLPGVRNLTAAVLTGAA